MVTLLTTWEGTTLSLETGKMARQADGAVLVRYGDSVVLCTVVGSKEASPSTDFFPLSVHYQEKAFAAGKIPGGYIKREGKPSEKEVLTSRLIDRPLRPLFPELFRNEVQIVCTVLSYDPKGNCEVAALIGASAALSISGLPFKGPVAAARVGVIDGKCVINPADMSKSDLNLMVAGTKEGVLMVESEAKELSEDLMLEAVTQGHKSFQPILEMIENLKKKVGKKIWPDSSLLPHVQAIEQEVKSYAEEKIQRIHALHDKQERVSQMRKLSASLKESLSSHPSSLVQHAFEALQSTILRSKVLKGVRVDGRDLSTVRSITSEVDFLPLSHGSALFTRGETQALVVTTLGTGDDQQMMDGLDGDFKEPFMLHYNFPSYSVGETGRMSGPGRREIGHGKLAWRALKAVLPSKEEWPYTMRVVAEITESNGSSSMATVCGGALSLMDAGVPLKRPVAGIAMGLVKEGDQFAVLSDILGDEDFLGDMDFKVAGTSEGITALQMDLKIDSVTPEIMKIALAQAKEGRLHILSEMAKTLKTNRASLKPHAPRIVKIKIHKDKIRDLIGPGGKNIRELCERTKTKIDVDDTGLVSICGSQATLLEQAISFVVDLGSEAEIGMTYEGFVVKLVDFGAFVRFLGSKEGLVHVSEVRHERVEKMSDVLAEGDIVKVKVLDVDGRGKVRLSMKALIEKI